MQSTAHRAARLRTVAAVLTAAGALLFGRATPILAQQSDLPQASAIDAVGSVAAANTVDAGDTVEEVVVRGRRLSEIEFDLRVYIRDFLEEVAAPSRNRGYARWHRTVCIGVHNLEASAAQYIVDRISALALDAGLEPGEPGCEPDVNIIFSANAAETAARMVEQEPRVFRPISGNAGMDLGLDALDRFIASEKPVRWWHVGMPVDARTGNPAIEHHKAACFRLHCYAEVAVAGPSRLHSGIRDELQYVIILVDGSQLTGTSWQQLSDYLAVVALAQIDPQTDPVEYDSILNLFSNPAAYSGLTDWDRHFVSALYSFDQERMPEIQGGDIVARIARRELTELD